jgi:hypothetical protein
MASMSINLDRTQCETIRSVIQTDANGYGDIGMFMRVRGTYEINRQSVVDAIEKLQIYVAVLDEIGWQEQPTAPDEQALTVDPALSTWARDQAAALERSFLELPPGESEVLEPVVLRLIAGAVA